MMKDWKTAMKSGKSDIIPVVVSPLPKGARPKEVISLVQCEMEDGLTWFVRTSSGLDDEEVLGLLTGYVEHLRQEAASMWSDTE